MKKRKLNKKGKLLIIFITILLIMSLNAILGTNKRRTGEIGANTPVEKKASENTVKMEIKDKPQVCGLSTIQCDNYTEEIETISKNVNKITLQIKKISEDYNIDWKLAVAIAKHETGNYTSYLFLNKNNIGGNYVDGEFKKFETLEDGIDYFISNLKRVYIDKGLDTPKKIQPIYAPLNVENDPNNLNSNWTSNVEAIYESLS